MSILIDLAEARRFPDSLVRVGIRRLVAQRLKDEGSHGVAAQAERHQRLLRELEQSPVALDTDLANEQHYEVPAEFFRAVLGKHLKYSSCYWERGAADLDEAEAHMLALYAERAELADGQRVLDLGCGWGSFTLWAAQRYPDSRFTAVSNSHGQRAYIEAQAAARGLNNVEVVTADVNELELPGAYDRIISVEMFEHMRNYALLLNRIAGWLAPDGKLFVHIFCHRHLLYPYETEGDGNWMGRYFFTSGLMPAADTLLFFQDDLRCERRWSVSGVNYEKTSRAWLENLDANEGRVVKALEETYGASEVGRWVQRWRMFFMACEELFAYRGGEEWLVCHYRFAPR
ncbi:MAG: methyltransferase domain-containing protein [Pseudomonadales bacterium]|nr:class I SAM-dependent methyltransferase [Pseudomonadales bacterium]NIX08731.1 methyltransferase domain-containing protein [Pseudomonadales bacterium]